MADPLSIVAGVIGITATTIHAIHANVQVIDDIKDAPSRVLQVRDELRDVGSIISLLKGTLENGGQTSTWSEVLDQSNLSGALRTLENACARFGSDLTRWTERSAHGNKRSFRDSINIALHSSKLSRLSSQLNSCKQTVNVVLSWCTLQCQIEVSRTTKSEDDLITQAREAAILLAAQRAEIESLRSAEQQLQIVKTQSEDAGDIATMESVGEEISDVSIARMLAKQLASVSEYVAKSSVATRTNQNIEDVDIAELGYGVVGMSNVDEVSDVSQDIRHVRVGRKGIGFVGISNNIDHNATLADLGSRE